MWDQRAGRAGREGPGTCRRLWTLAEQQRRKDEKVLDPLPWPQTAKEEAGHALACPSSVV